MKISAINSLYNSYNNFLSNKNNINTTNVISSTNSILKNSLAEAIGRSQIVSFSGSNRTDGDMVYHECDEGIGGYVDDIKYNKIDGSYVRTTTTHRGTLVSKEEYYPQEKKEVRTNVKNSITYKTTRIPGILVREEFDEKKRPIFYEKNISNGISHQEITEYDKNRRIIQKFNRDELKSIQVIDLRTGKPTTQRELAENTKYDAETDTYLTYNMVTGKVYVEEKFKPNGVRQYRTEYFEHANQIEKQTVYNEKTGGEDTTVYREDGSKEAFISVSKNRREERVYEYDEDGYTITSQTLNIYNRNGEIRSETNYKPRTNTILSKTEYKKNNEKQVTTYSQRPNVPFESTFYKGNNVTFKVQYQPDGENYLYSEEYLDDGETLYTHYDKESRVLTEDIADSSSFIYEHIDYSPENGKIRRIINYNKKTGSRTEQIYKNGTKYPDRVAKYDKNDKPIEITDYYLRSRIPAKKRVFAKDGSFVLITYNEFGEEQGRRAYNADSENSYQRTNERSRAQRSQSSGVNNRRTAKTQEELDFEAALRIQKIVTSADLDILDVPDEDWEALSRIVGAVRNDENENPIYLKKQDFFNMNSEMFRPLTKRFHPDINTDADDKNKSGQIFVILNALYRRNK